MNYYVDFSCGHKAVVNLYGSYADRKKRMEWLEKNELCPDCKTKKTQKLLLLSVNEAKKLARKELENLGLEVNLDNLEYKVAFGRSSKIYDENMPMTSAAFSQFEETSADAAEKCFIDIVNEDGHTARAVIKNSNIDVASSVIARAILMSYADAAE